MKTDSTVAESCETQVLSDGAPSEAWALPQLTQFATQQYQAIVAAEKPLAVLYFRLGKALAMARQKYKHGSWGKFLVSLGIDKTRASKAVAIYRTCNGEENVASLTVEKAYAQRERKNRRKPPVDSVKLSSPAVLRDFLKILGIELEQLPKVIAGLSPQDARELERDMHAALKRFEDLINLVHSRVKSIESEA